MKFLARLLCHTFTFLFVCLPLMLAGTVILLFVCPFMPKDRIRLPYLVRWFDIVDDYIGRDTSVIQKIYAGGWWDRYVYCGWRNSVNYFDYMFLGLRWDGRERYTRYNPAESDIGDGFGQRTGLRYISVEREGHLCTCSGQPHLINKHYFEYYFIYQYPFAKKVCFRFRLGWKIKDRINLAGTVSQWVFVISPWKRYDGV